MKRAAAWTAPIDLTEAGRRFWHWWTGELGALVPQQLKNLVADRKGRLLLRFDTERAILYHEFGHERRVLTTIERAGPSEARDLLAVVRQHQRASPDNLTLELPATDALRRVIVLPAAAEGNLDQVVSFELERHTPFKRAETRHAYRILRRDPVGHRVVLELTVVPRPVFDTALARLRALGLAATRVEVAGDGEHLMASPNLLPTATGSRTRRLWRVAIAGLSAVAVILAAVFVSLPFYRQHVETERLTQALATAKREANDSAALQREIHSARRDSGFLVARKRLSMPMSQLLDTLTRILPDDTSLTELRAAGGELQITGIGASASSLIARLAETPGFSNAVFRSPVTQDAKSKREQFDIGSRLDQAHAP